MFIVFDIIFLLFGLVYLPYGILKGKFYSGLKYRLGIFPPAQEFRSPIWLHAVSVGEAKATGPLLNEIRKKYPARQVVISTVTATGNKIARSFAQENDFVFYLPFDFSFIVKRTIARIKPSICIIAETEIWPNFISYLKQEGVPVALVNARLSDRSFRGYKCVYYLARFILDKVSLFCVQTEADAKRFIALGATQDKVKVTGNMKFDVVVDYPECSDFSRFTSGSRSITSTDRYIRDTDFGSDYTDMLGMGKQDKLWVCGSTHRGEEEIILRTYKELMTEFPGLRLILAPRHPERAKEVEKLVTDIGLKPVLFSKLTTYDLQLTTDTVFILDTIGQLASLYSLATVVFVGGSLVKKGGHNIIEPAYFKKPVLTGPYMFNFREITDCFLKGNALIRVHNAQALKSSLRRLLKDNALQAEYGRRMNEVFRRHQGAIGKTADCLDKILK